MPFKCFSCGLSFDTAEKYAEHSLVHQQQQECPENRGLVCLKCGEYIPVDSLEDEFTGNIVCHNCQQIVRVIIRNGEIELAMSSEVAEQTEEELIKQYYSWLIRYIEIKDLIDHLVPVPANLSKGDKMPTIEVTEDLLVKFKYAESTMAFALKKRQEIHEKLYRLQKERRTDRQDIKYPY